MSDLKTIDVEKFDEELKKARACHAEALEVCIGKYFEELIDRLDKADVHMGYLMDAPHKASGHVPLNGAMAIPYTFTVDIKKPEITEKLLEQQKKDFPGVPIKHLKV